MAPRSEDSEPRRRFRPTLWLTLCTLGALAILIALGIWQLQRLDWKNAMIAERQGRLSATPIAMPANFDDPAEFQFRRVEVAGRFLHDRELYLGGRVHKRVVGFHVVTPLLLDDGRALLVDRGWVPPERRDPASRADGQVEGRVVLEAVLRTGGWKGRAFLRPDNDAVQNHWIWLDLPAMAEAAGIERPVLEFYAVAAPVEVPGGLPIALATEVDLRNDHLQYALTWFALAVALIVIYVLVSLRRPPAPG